MSVDTLIDGAKTDVAARLEKLRTEIKAIPPPAPPSNVYDSFPTTYDLTQDNQLSTDGKWRLIYTGYNPSNTTIRGKAGVRVPDKLPPDNSPRVFYAYPYAYGYAGTGTNATLSLTQTKFKNFDLTFYMRTVKSLRTVPRNWEVTWLLLRFADHFHHYFYNIKRDGRIEFGRKDNTTNLEEQTFLSTNQTTTFAEGLWIKNRIKAVGNHFTIWVNDIQKIDLTDDGTIGSRSQANGQPIAVQPPSAAMFDGSIGNYAEDAIGEWTPMTIQTL